MGTHYFGTIIDGQRGRFQGGISDAGFEELLNWLGGELPRGFIAWHLQDGETSRNSRRVQAIRSLPIIVRMNHDAIENGVQAVIEAHFFGPIGERYPEAFKWFSSDTACPIVQEYHPTVEAAGFRQAEMTETLANLFPGHPVHTMVRKVISLKTGLPFEYTVTAVIQSDEFMRQCFGLEDVFLCECCHIRPATFWSDEQNGEVCRSCAAALDN